MFRRLRTKLAATVVTVCFVFVFRRSTLRVMLCLTTLAFGASRATADERASDGEDDWVIRIPPGFGYLWDSRSVRCRWEGVVSGGGAQFVAGSAPVRFGGAATVLFGVTRNRHNCGPPGQSTFRIMTMLGPLASVHPWADDGWYLIGVVGWAGVSRDRERGDGVGTMLGIGYEVPAGEVSLGLLARVTAFTTWGERHAAVAPEGALSLAF